MILIPLTNGAVAGVHTLTVPRQIVGGVLITTNNTDAVTVTIRRENAGGMIVIHIATVTTMWIGGPFGLDDTDKAYVSVTGTGGAAQVYEWVP